MRQFGHLWATLAGVACGLLTGELAAQQSAPVSLPPLGQSVRNINTQGNRPPEVQATRPRINPQNQPVSESSFIAVIGAVKTPTVFESAEPAVLLKTLVERAGGETSESIGTVRIMDRTHTRFMTTLRDHLDLAVIHGQVVFVVPRGGRPARVTDPRQPPPDRMVLISGLARGPLLFNIGNQSRTLGDLLLLLGQSPEMITRQQVKATQPQGQWMELDSLLVHNTVIDFNSEGVNTDGVRAAVDKGFRYELPVHLTAPATAEPGVSVPVKILPAGSAIAPQSPQIQPLPARHRIAPTTTDRKVNLPTSGIERAGSSIPFDEPMQFPARSTVDDDVKEEATPPSSSSQPFGRTPLMLPKTWQSHQVEEAEAEEEDPARTIERTSADLSSGNDEIITVSAHVEEVLLRRPALEKTISAAEPKPFRVQSPILKNTSSFPGPQSWLALLATVGVAVTSVVVSRIVSRADATTPHGSESALDPLATPPSTHQDEQRFLQLLIVNKVPLIEEEAVLPPVDRLHGMAIGGRRLIIHEAHEGVAGPHFQTRDSSSTQAVELRLRRLMRSDRSRATHPATLVPASPVTGARTSRVSPLERALRNVEQGGT